MMKRDSRLRGNIALVYGGGQIPVANKIQGAILTSLLDELTDAKVYGIHKSFMGLVDSSLWEEVDKKLADKISNMPGTYFGTCRNFYPTKDEHFDKVLSNIDKHNITTIIVTGGDGSARACKALHERFELEGYSVWIYWLPCTIDGIFGTDCIGYESAVAESVRTARNLAINSWATYDSELPRIAVVQVMGRNRDDILFGCLRKFYKDYNILGCSLKNLTLIGIPSASSWSIEDLMARIKKSPSPFILIIVSEGAKPTDLWYPALQASSIADGLSKLILPMSGRKTNSHVIGYLAQTNDAEGDDDIKDWSSALMTAMKTTRNNCRPVAIVKRQGAFSWINLASIVRRNPDSSAPISISEETRKELGRFLI